MLFLAELLNNSNLILPLRNFFSQVGVNLSTGCKRLVGQLSSPLSAIPKFIHIIIPSFKKRGGRKVDE